MNLRKLFRGNHKGKVILLSWYSWVDVDLFSYFRTLFGEEYDLKLISKSMVESMRVSDKEFMKLEFNGAEDFREIAYDDLYLWEICKSSICDHLMRSSVTWEKDQKVIREYYRKAVQLIEAFKRFFDQEKPHAIVVEQGFQYDMRIAVEVARRYGCKTVAIENSFLKDYFFLDSASGTICNRHFLSRNAWDILRARKISCDEREELREFMSSYSTMIEQGEAIGSGDLRGKLGIPKGKKIAMLFGQVATDAAIIMDSPTYVELTQFIEDTVKIMEKYKSEYHLIIRLHPKEAWGNNHHGVPFDNMTLKKLQASGIDDIDYVTVLHSKEVNTYHLMDIADFAITINSQAGLELLSRHKPLLVLGDAFYSGKQFTFDVTCRETLPVVIDKVVNKPVLTNKQCLDIDKFLYYMIFEYLFPKKLIGCESRIKRLFE